MSGKKIGGWYRFEDWIAPDPDDEKLSQALHTARYNLAGLTQTDAYRILSAAEAYCHFAGHPASDTSILGQLRTLRNRIKAERNGDAP